MLHREAPEVGVTVADARFMKPLDEELIASLAEEHDVIVTVEEGSIGGFGDHVNHFLTNSGKLDDGGCRLRTMVVPDQFIEAGGQGQQYEFAGLQAKHIAATALKALGRNREALGLLNTQGQLVGAGKPTVA
jgi:1-deoxy-D-xylulose-5-phosphate synthase